MINITAFLAKEIADILTLPVSQVMSSDFDDLGLTSVNMTELVGKLSGTFPELPITIFYEYKNLAALALFLNSHYAEIVAEQFTESTLENKVLPTDVAIIGMAGYFPGATNIEAFWDLLLGGKTAFTEVPKERWNVDDFYHADENKIGYTYSRWGAFLKDVDKFDPLLFNISPRDAAKIDPQERLFLQASYTALEDAGCIGLLHENAAQKVSVYVGVTNASYGWLENEEEQWRQIKHVNVSSAYWSVANRVSYTFNFTGPSLSIDTACASSLTALHLACQSLINEECTHSIVGGVNLILHPRQYTELSEMKMLSRGKHNKTFSDAADGFIYGEGVIALVLKLGTKAIEDKDPIYALIKATSINANGKTSGYTVPNPNAQAALISEAIAKSGYQASDIQYVECHGTGTKLGDPIEIRGLTKAFRETTANKQYCLIGSVKTNIGHLESAAGMAGVVKAALQITRKTLVPNVLVEPLNQTIDFANSPFQVVKEIKPWPKGQADLVSCVSSFGAGGANAHAILTNSPDFIKQSLEKDSYIVTLSANHPRVLRQKLEELYAWLKAKNSDLDLGNLVYTLNNLRLHYAQRMAFIFKDKECLEQQVLGVLANEVPANYYGNSIVEHQDHCSDELLHQFGLSYVQGEFIDWQQLYAKADHQAIKAPTYPFLKERCWISDELIQKTKSESQPLHPFIDGYNQEQHRCTKTFDANHFAFAEHVLKGEKIFPGVCHLEMVHEAYTKCYNNAVGAISEITWLAPMNLNDELCQAELSFNNTAAGTAYQLGKRVDGEFLLCSQGKITTAKKESTVLDIPSYKKHVTEQIDGASLYAFFKEKGWYHGPAFQSVNQLYFSDELLVAEIQAPQFYNDQRGSYGLNPGIMDGILQAITILNMRVSTQGAIALPFYLQALHLIKPLPAKVCALVTLVESKGKNRSKFYNVAVTDSSHTVCLQLSGFTMALVQEKNHVKDLHYYAQQMVPTTLFAESKPATTTPCRVFLVDQHHDALAFAKSTDVIINVAQLENKALRTNLQGRAEVHLINLVDLGKTNLHQLVYGFIAFIQNLLKEQIKLHFIFSCEYAHDELGTLGPCMPGFYKSLHAEHPGIKGCHLKIASQDKYYAEEKITLILNQPQHCPQLSLEDNQLKYLQVTPIKPKAAPFQFQHGATYLIAGGLGGLGRQLAYYLTQQYGAQVVLLGRSVLHEEGKEFLNTCKSAYYYQVDVCNAAELAQWYQQIHLVFPKIHGVFNLVAHAQDTYFIQKDLHAFTKTCATKIESTLNLDHLLADQPLAFFVLFSSIAAVLGNRGQTDYAAANAWFQDFSEQRNQYVTQALRHGTTVSLCWPYISGGGFQLDAVYQKWMQEQWGMQPLTLEHCIAVIPEALSFGVAQVLPFMGNQEQLVNYYNKNCLPNENTQLKQLPVAPQNHTVQLEQQLKTLVATHQKIKAEDLDVDADLTVFGYNSISFTELSTIINEQFSISTTPAIFFDATCIRDLSELLIDDYPQVFAIKESLDPEAVAVEEVPFKELRSFEEPIAIIGYHARFPGAQTAEEYWSNLSAGICSITEIPKDRWRWQDVYGNPEDGDFTRSKWGGFIKDLDKFDARFFGISPREAELMDPQQRIFLQSVYHAMEHAGYTKTYFAKHKTGLYVGVSLFEYGKLLQQEADIDAYTSSGTVHSIVANRVSYLLGLTGPSIALDTACSSSLVAVHEAVKALRYGDCELAIAGGVNALIEPSFYIAFDKAGMLSPDGTCKTFDKSANGYVRGEGVATLILKPLKRALQDKDPIYGLVKETGINHGGNAQTMTSPNPSAQADLIIQTVQKAQIPFNSIQYIECHGTGTPLGDPVEVNGLKKAYKVLQETNIELQQEALCGIGSVKTNIGHLESSSGVAGILKVLLMMQHKQLIKTLNFSQLNPYIDLGNTPFYVVNENKPWPENKTKAGQSLPLRAAVSGFGFGGANAHVILEQASEQSTLENAKNKPCYLITLSAMQEQLVQQKIEELLLWLEGKTEDILEVISFTLNQGREHFKYKFACIAASQQDLLQLLQDYLVEGKTSSIYTNIGTDALPTAQDLQSIYVELKTPNNDYQNLLITLAKAYVAGAKIDWLQVHQGEAQTRIALPVYPFEKKRYWFTKKVNQYQAQTELNPELSASCYTRLWEQFVPQLKVNATKNSMKLVVSFDKEVQATFKNSFPFDVTHLVFDESQHGASIDKNDVFSYMDALAAVGIVEVIYFLCPQKSCVEDLTQEYLRYFFRFVKSMRQVHYEQHSVTIKVITFGITNLHGEHQQLAAGAGIQGFAKTLAQEFLDWHVEQFDLSMDTTALPALLHQPLNVSGHLCVFRDGVWYKQRLVPQKITPRLKPVVLKQGGTYLIIGGMGGIGQVLAQYLTRHYQAHIVVVGRRPAQEINSDYQYIQCDITKEHSVRALYDNLQNNQQVLDGLFHCAMVLKDQSIRFMSEAHLNEVIQPKSLGTYHLVTLLGELVQDFIAVFSSTESYFALPGQSNYTAASWLQDQLAEEFYQHHKKIKLIHWGLWEEAGVVASPEYQKALHQLGFIGLKNKEALELLEFALNHSEFEITLLGIKEQAKALYPIFQEQHSLSDPYQVVNEKALNLLWAAFNNMNFWTDVNPVVSTQQLFNATNYSKSSISLLHACIVLLIKNNYIKAEASNSYQVIGNQSQTLAQVIEETKQSMTLHPEVKPFLEALIRTTTQLFEFLKGTIEVTQLLCPMGELSLLSSLYAHNALVNPINLLVAKKVEGLVLNQLVQATEVRILEIGAGCGGTTAAVLDLLADKSMSIKYTFTDISPAFLNRAKTQFAQHPNLDFQLLDIESSSFNSEGFDLVIASNVLHATKEIQHTLNACKKYLKNHGSLIINEVTQDQPFLTLIFGFFPGWWAFQDAYRMPHSPLLSPENWRFQLNELGFKHIEITHTSANDPHTLICAINAEVKEMPHQTPQGFGINEKISALLSAVLKCPESDINPYISFADLGLDSITGVSFIAKINKEFGTNLPVSIIFSHKNIDELQEKIKTKDKQHALELQPLSPMLLFEE